MIVDTKKLWIVNTVSALAVGVAATIIAGPKWGAFLGAGAFAVIPAKIMTERFLASPRRNPLP
jgi:hypothetical protein